MALLLRVGFAQPWFSASWLSASEFRFSVPLAIQCDTIRDRKKSENEKTFLGFNSITIYLLSLSSRGGWMREEKGKRKAAPEILFSFKFANS